MRRGRQRIHRRPSDVFELLQECFGVKEQAWHEERIEQLGRTIFGDLWESDEAKNEEGDQAGVSALTARALQTPHLRVLASQR